MTLYGIVCVRRGHRNEAARGYTLEMLKEDFTMSTTILWMGLLVRARRGNHDINHEDTIYYRHSSRAGALRLQAIQSYYYATALIVLLCLPRSE